MGEVVTWEMEGVVTCEMVGAATYELTVVSEKLGTGSPHSSPGSCSA